MAGIMNSESMLAAMLDRLARLVDGSQGGPSVPVEVQARSRARALLLANAAGPRPRAGSGAGDDMGTLGTVAFAAEMCCALDVDFAAHPADAERFIGGFEEITGLCRALLGREVLRRPQLPMLSTDVAIEVQLALLLIFARVQAVSLWALWPGAELRCISHAGPLAARAVPARQAAGALLGDPAADVVARDAALGIRLDRWQHEPGALIAHGVPPAADHRLMLLEAAAPALAALDERAQLLTQAGPSGETLTNSLERRLARLRFDLHDGPQQDVHLLASDLALFRAQLLPIVADDPNYDRIVGRLDDLAAQLVALDGDLRRLSSSVQSPFLPAGTLDQALHELTDSFATRTGIGPRAELRGDFTALTESQQITLLALIREALSNVREHSDARHVTIAVTSQAHGVDAQVIDDGRGFDPETTLLRAARDGHLGLVGMHERVRMLGGRTQIESRPGGPTVISVSLPAWPSAS
jgi:signal transduction histidine kinase